MLEEGLIQKGESSPPELLYYAPRPAENWTPVIHALKRPRSW